MRDIKTAIGFIDCTPTWEETVRTCAVLFRDGDARGQRVAIEELVRAGRLADAYVARERADAAWCFGG